jgi:hypothetical protein
MILNRFEDGLGEDYGPSAVREERENVLAGGDVLWFASPSFQVHPYYSHRFVALLSSSIALYALPAPYTNSRNSLDPEDEQQSDGKAATTRIFLTGNNISCLLCQSTIHHTPPATMPMPTPNNPAMRQVHPDADFNPLCWRVHRHSQFSLYTFALLPSSS